MFDVAVIGGGPAGLSAALMLGRCRRRVIVCDAGRPRNAAATALHGYLTRDGTPPLDLLRIGREELRGYGVEWQEGTVTDVVAQSDGFAVHLASGDRLSSQTVLFATGVQDHVPQIDGMDRCYGVSVHHCPYCDGWEVRDRAIAVIGQGAAGAALSLSLKTWSDRVVLCTNGRARIGREQRAQLGAHRIEIVEGPIERLDHLDGQVRALVLHQREPVACEAVFFTTGQSAQCDLPRRLGCEFTRKGTVKTDHLGQTCVPGIYVVGDASRDVQFVVVAAAEGAKAAVAINKALQARVGLVAATAQS